jgi:hypothetical protein
MDDPTIKIQYDCVIKQFEMLRLEAHQRLSYFIQIYQIYAVGLTAVYGYIIANKHWDILLFFPFMSVSLYMRVLWDQKVLFYISDYSKFYLAPWFEYVMRLNQPQWIIWDEYYPKAFANYPAFYKHSLFMVFAVISIFPSILYCIYNVYAACVKAVKLTELEKIGISENHFIVFMLIAAIIFIGMFIWITFTTYSHRY